MSSRFVRAIDAAVAAVAPQHALRRARARAQLQVMDHAATLTSQALADAAPSSSGGGTVGGGSPLLRHWSPAARDASSDTLRHLPLQRAQSRELARVNPIAGGAINTVVDRVVGTGLALVATPARKVLRWSETQAQAWREQVQTEFALWADTPACDWTNTLNFFDAQALTLRSALESGDTFTLLPDAPREEARGGRMPYRLRLQQLEADRIGNPLNGRDTATEAGGIRFDTAGRRLAAHVYDNHPGSLLISGRRYLGNWVDFVGRSGRRRILQHLRMTRPGQPRGVPYLAPVVNELKQLTRYTEAEIQAAVVSAFFTVFVETENGGNPAPVFGATAEQAATQKVELGPGAVVGLAKGESASIANPGRPNPSFQPFVLAVIQQIGVGLSLPYELLIKQFNASYSASKASILDAWMFLRARREWLARSYCQPVYETWMAEAVFLGRIAAPGFFTDPLLRWAYTRAGWHGDSMGSINPKDEVAAYTAAVDARLMTRERAEWELFGSDWYLSIDAKATEQRMLAERDLLPLPRAGAAAAPGAPAAPAAPKRADGGDDAEDEGAAD